MNILKISIIAMLALSGVLWPAVAQAEEAAKSWHVLKARNVRPGILAWWIDPKHNSEPIEFSQTNQIMQELLPLTTQPVRTLSSVVENSDRTLTNFRPPFSKPGLPAIGLPIGIDIVIGVDAREELLVFGTQDGLRSLESILTFLDKSLPTVEISAYDVELEATTAQALGLDWDATSPFTLAPHAAENFQASLKALTAESKAKIINAPRVTALNNAGASLHITTSTPIRIRVSNWGKEGWQISTPAISDASEMDALIYASEAYGITFIPTINKDKTVTLILKVGTTRKLQPTSTDNASLALPDSNVIQTVINVRDGETVAIGGLRTLAQEKGKSEAKEKVRVYFVTAKIIKRAEEK